MQIFQSLIQSHLNYCSIVWGFTAKSNIESLFRIQKKGIRAIVPGFINYKYRDGELPSHTKPYFNEYKNFRCTRSDSNKRTTVNL